MVKDFHLFEYNKGMETRKWSEDDKRRSKDFITVKQKRLQNQKDLIEDLEILLEKNIGDIGPTVLINRTTRTVTKDRDHAIYLIGVNKRHPSETYLFTIKMEIPARAYIKQAQGYLKNGDGDEIPSFRRCQVNKPYAYTTYALQQDGDPSQDYVRLWFFNDDLKKVSRSQSKTKIGKKTKDSIPNEQENQILRAKE
ncbi:hypothetical protein Tco_0909172 [Tanacetum coccineum]|uniref:Uncharacterized protein n=1 Tax=Tanacetum coccineum TaxID=301880 RepID=A0ABQ5CR98_9ASTR